MGVLPLRTPCRTASLAFGVLLSCGGALRAQVFVVGMKSATADTVTQFHPTHVSLPQQKLDERGRLDLLRNLEAEQGFAHRELPLGAGVVLLANGNMTPRDEEYRRMLYEKGQSAAPGDRVEVSKLDFRPDRIIIDFNGGPYAKHRFLSHIQLNGMQLAQQGPIATGCRVTLIFEGGVPEVTAAEVKALLDPVVDFKAKSSAEAYADTLPSKVREAIDAHEILVGMDRRMVLASLGEPKTKHREHVGMTTARCLKSGSMERSLNPRSLCVFSTIGSFGSRLPPWASRCRFVKPMRSEEMCIRPWKHAPFSTGISIPGLKRISRAMHRPPCGALVNPTRLQVRQVWARSLCRKMDRRIWSVYSGDSL